MKNQERTTVTVKGGFYTAVVVQLDLFESRIIDERHFATKEEAEDFQIKTVQNNDNIYCFVSLVS